MQNKSTLCLKRADQTTVGLVQHCFVQVWLDKQTSRYSQFKRPHTPNDYKKVSDNFLFRNCSLYSNNDYCIYLI